MRIYLETENKLIVEYAPCGSAEFCIFFCKDKNGEWQGQCGGAGDFFQLPEDLRSEIERQFPDQLFTEYEILNTDSVRIQGEITKGGGRILLLDIDEEQFTGMLSPIQALFMSDEN